jgi:hypothetical protein
MSVRHSWGPLEQAQSFGLQVIAINLTLDESFGD